MKLDEKLTEMDYIRLLYVIHYVLHNKAHYPDRYYRYGAAINRNVLAETLCVNHAKASRILKHLLSWQILDKARGYWQGSHSRGFRLNTRLEALPVSFRAYKAEDVYFIHKLLSATKLNLKEPLLNSQYTILNEHVSINEEGLDYLKLKYNSEFLNSLIYDYREGKPLSTDFNTLFSKIEVDATDIGLLTFLIRDIYVVRPNDRGRIYTPLSNLKREFRPYLLLGGKPPLMTDLINSQIVFSVALIESTWRSVNRKLIGELPADLMKYREWALSGRFYEELAKAASYPLSVENRGTFKKALFQEIFFGPIRSRGGMIRKAFKKLFPTVTKVINHIKRDAYADFSIELQNMEAGIFVDCALDSMIRKKKMALSLHDSIVVASKEDLALAESFISDAMDLAYDLTPKFKREG